MYHLTDDGPKKCSTTPDRCPITKESGDEHYSSFSVAQDAYEKSNQNFLKPKRIGLRKVKLKSGLQIFKKSYLGLKVDNSEISEHVELWKKQFPRDEANLMEESKITRDSEYAFHITVISPKEFRQLRKSGVHVNLDDFNYTITGIGSVSDEEKEAWYLTVSSSEIDNLRTSLELPPKDLHITLGFKNSDIHTKPKGLETLKFI